MTIADRIGALAPAVPVEVLGTPTRFIPHDGRPERILAQLGLDADGIAAAVRGVLLTHAGAASARSSTSPSSAPAPRRGDALAATTELARRAEELGYDRFWVAEHHNMPTVASTSPPVLMAHLAASTSSIRVGSGGVMLPNHAPLVVAEQFAMLEALHPGRIDLGIGRAPGTDPATAAALRRSPDLGAEDFPRDLLDLMGLLGDERVEHGGVVAVPGDAGGDVQPADRAARLERLLGAARRAARPGVRLRPPLRPAGRDRGRASCTGSRSGRRPSSTSRTRSSRPACWPPTTPSRPSTSPARPAWPCSASAPAGGWPLLPPDEAAVHPDIDDRPGDAVEPHRRRRRRASANELQALAERTGADEMMVSTMTHGLPERIRTLELVAEHWPR